MTTKLKPIDILLVEDNPGDVRLTQEAMHDAKVRNKLHVVNNGVEALAYLRHTGKYAQEQYPDLILLDLNLPQMGGGEVLEKIKEDEKLRRIPVVVLTTSQAEHDLVSGPGSREGWQHEQGSRCDCKISSRSRQEDRQLGRRQRLHHDRGAERGSRRGMSRMPYLERPDSRQLLSTPGGASVHRAAGGPVGRSPSLQMPELGMSPSHVC